MEDGAAPPAKPAPEQQGGAARTEGHGRHIFLGQETARPQRPAGLLQAPCQQYPLPTQELSFPQSYPCPFCIPWAAAPGSALLVPALAPWSNSPGVRAPGSICQGPGHAKGVGEEASEAVGKEEELGLAEKSMQGMQMSTYSCNSQGRDEPGWVSAKTD